MNKYIPLPVQYAQENDIPPRLQWNHNGGYCGEVSMVSAGLYYGQYLSQYDVRVIASNGGKQNAQKPPGSGNYSSQLLLGVNAATTAKAVRLAHEEFNAKDSKKFLAWVKNHVAQGHPVVIGVFNNENMLYSKENGGSEGDPEYDHIVPVFGFGSNHPLTDQTYYPDDVILFSDNGLYTQPGSPPGYATPLQGYTDQYQYYFTLDTGEESPVYNFLLGRNDANNSNGNIYSLLDLPTYQSSPPSKNNYALAITGVKDPNRETLPVRVDTNINREHPSIASDSNERPTPMELTLTVTVSDLTPHVTYNLYRYDDENKVPTEKFNYFAKNAVSSQPITIDSGTAWSTTLKILSDQKVFFRAVAATSD